MRKLTTMMVLAAGLLAVFIGSGHAATHNNDAQAVPLEQVADQGPLDASGPLLASLAWGPLVIPQAVVSFVKGVTHSFYVQGFLNVGTDSVAGLAAGDIQLENDLTVGGDTTLGTGTAANFPVSRSFHQDPELGDGTKEGAVVGQLTVTASTAAEADLTYAYLDDGAGAASIAASEQAAACNSATADDCDTFASAGAEASGDALYYCAASRFHGLGYTITGTAATYSGGAGKYQYPTADDTWADLTELSDGSLSAHDTQEQTGRVLFAMPENWFENATGGTKAMAADSGFCVRFVLTGTAVTQVAIMDQVTVILPAVTDEDLPQVATAGTLVGVSSNCEVANSGVPVHLTIWNATTKDVTYYTQADGNYCDHTGSLTLAFSAGDELAIVSDCDSSGATCAEGCTLLLDFQ